MTGTSLTVESNDSLTKDPHHVGSLTSLGAIGVLRRNKEYMCKAETALRGARTSLKDDRYVRHILLEISRSQGRNADDVSRSGIMLNPASSREWTNLSCDGDDAARLALNLAQHDNRIDVEELSSAYEKSGSLGDVQAGILLSPWRIRGWQKLKEFS